MRKRVTSLLQENRVVRVFKALCDPTRLCLLTWLGTRSRPQNVREVAGCCDVDLSVVSRHLSLMREAGILRSERKGKEVYYSINTKEISAILRSIADALEACCCLKTCKTKGGEKR